MVGQAQISPLDAAIANLCRGFYERREKTCWISPKVHAPNDTDMRGLRFLTSSPVILKLASCLFRKECGVLPDLRTSSRGECILCRVFIFIAAFLVTLKCCMKGITDPGPGKMISHILEFVHFSFVSLNLQQTSLLPSARTTWMKSNFGVVITNGHAKGSMV